MIWRDAPVSIRFVTEEDAKRLPLRKGTARSGTLRLIEIEGVDLSACGIASVKFLSPVLPGQPVAVSHHSADGRTIRFTLTHGERKVASGCA